MNKRQKRITIKDVAREADVSITTVSRYLNQNYESMSEQTKNRIEEVIKLLNYHPNKLAQGLKGTSRTIAVVVTNMGYPFCVSVIRSMSKVLSEEGYNLVVCETGGQVAHEEKIIRSLMAQHVDGIVIQTNGDNNSLLEEIAQRMPVLCIDREFSIPSVLDIVTNNSEASEQLTCSLFKEGYEQILYVTEPINDVSTRVLRLKGYRQACELFHKSPWIVSVERGNMSSLKAVIEVLHTNQPQDKFAVYTSNGLIMLELYPLLKETGYSIPDPMGLATFDEPDWAKITTPPLTCVRQPTDEIGHYAATTILQSIKNGKMQLSDQKAIIINSTLMLNRSSQLRI